MYRGKRIDGADYFDDAIEETEGGILEGHGRNDFEGIREKVHADGVQVDLACRLCGKRHAVTLEWEELYVVGSNGPNVPPVFPPGWAYSPNNQDAFIEIRCSKCGNNGIAPHVRPEEARGYINTAVQNGRITPNQIGAWKQGVLQARGG